MSTKSNKKRSKNDSKIEQVVETEIEFICPKRGKVKQKVKLKKLKSVKLNISQIVGHQNSVSDLEDQDDGLLLISSSSEE